MAAKTLTPASPRSWIRLMRIHACALLFAMNACTGSNNDPVQAPPADGAAVEAEATLVKSDPEPAPARVEKLIGAATQNGVALSEGDSVDLNAEIAVGEGLLVLSVTGAGELRLFPKSRASLERRGSLKLLLGRIWLKISELAGGETFEVTTSNAVAGVRGTEFSVQVAGDNTRVSVVEGKVAVKNRNRADDATGSGETLVEPGQTTVVAVDAPPSKVEKFEAEILEREWRGASERFMNSMRRKAPPKRPNTRPGNNARKGAAESHEELDEVEEGGIKKLEREGDAVKKELKRQESEEREKIKTKEEALKKELKTPKSLEKDLEDPGKGSAKDLF